MLVIMKNWINGNGNLAVDILQVGSFCPLFPGLIGIWNVELQKTLRHNFYFWFSPWNQKYCHITTWLTSVSLQIKGLATKYTTVKRPNMEFSYTCSKNCRPSLNWSSSFTLCNLRGQKVDLKFTQQNMQSVALQSSYDHGGFTLNHRTRERGNFIFHATLT